MELLNKIQRELKVPKSQFNAFAKYNYRNCEDILEAVKPLLGDGVLTLSDEVVEVGGRCYVKATARLYSPSPADGVTVTAYAREALDKKGMDEAQITGAASSYARKYALNGLFCIDDTKDADNEDNSAKAAPANNVTVAKAKTPQQGTKSVTVQQQKEEIKKLLDEGADAPLKTKSDYEAECMFRTGMKLEEANYGEILAKLNE